MSSVSSNQSFVRDGVGFEKLYLSGYRDPDELSERSPSAASPSLKNEDMELAELEEGFDDGEQRIKSVVGTDGLREFFMLPEWTVNNFMSTIKETHFKTLRAIYQIPDYIPIRLPYKSEKCYYDGVDDVGVYEQVFKAGLRFPLNSLKRELLQHLGLSVSQISPNFGRVFIAMEVLCGAMSDGARSLKVREFLHCYRLDEIDKSKGMYSFVPRKSVLKVIYETPDSNRDWKSRYFFLEGDGWMCHLREMDYMLVDKTWGILDPSGIYISVTLRMCFIVFFNTFMTVLIAPSLCFLQYDGAPKLISRSTTFLKEFLQSLNQRNRHGLSL